jgi:hypothetical protein
MAEFLRAVAAGPGLVPSEVFVRLVLALLLGFAVAWVYRKTRPEGEVTPSFPKTLILLSVLIAMVTQVIGDNTARAFSLVGALSIVRFRTVVRDTEDTAFVIFAVAVGMGVGASQVLVALSGLGLIGAASFLMRERTIATADAQAWFLLSVRVGLGHDIRTLLDSTLDAHVADRRLMSMATVRQGMSIDVSYETRLRKEHGPDDLVKALNRIEGVQNVELQRKPTETS